MDGYLSDDSDFYGDSVTVKELQSRAEAFDVKPFWQYHARLPAVTLHNAQTEARKNRGGLRNPYEGEAYHARQLDESAADFVMRLPPSTTHRNDAGEFLWIADPTDHPSFLDVDHKGLMEDGSKLLDKFMKVKADTEAKMAGKSAPTTSKKLRMAQDKLAKDIQAAAVKRNLITGKWMLFPKAADLDRVWRIVCEALLDGMLGQCAKVATAGAKRGGEDARLVCVYTNDFSDKADVGRVLRSLASRDLVRKGDGERLIWYKIDAYTHLGIEGKNDYGLRNSLYGSNDFL